MKTFYAAFLTAILCVGVSLTAHAQLKYVDGRLTMDTSPEGNYKITFAGNGAYFKMPSQSNFFQIDISGEKTRLAGHGDEIQFYNSATNNYNSIRVQNVYYQSDARAKTNIHTFTNGSSVIALLRPVSYQFINGSSSNNRASKEEIGLLAQEVEAILPGAVITDETGGKLINYNALIPVLIDAVKSLQDEVAALKAGK